MQRYFISPQQISGETINIEGMDVHHMRNVMRFRRDDRVICCDGQGTDFLGVITSIDTTKVTIRIVDRSASWGEPQTEVILCQAILKGERWDWLLQKATELGVNRIVPFTSERTIVNIDVRKQMKKQERWQRIVKEAAEQSHRGSIPIVETVQSWRDILSAHGSHRTLIAYEQGGMSLHHALSDRLDQPIRVIVGPEGGFSEREIAQAKQARAIAITLGKRILRADTAAVVTLTCVYFQAHDIGDAFDAHDPADLSGLHL